MSHILASEEVSHYVDSKHNRWWMAVIQVGKSIYALAESIAGLSLVAEEQTPDKV